MNIRTKLFTMLGIPFIILILVSFFFIINIISNKVSTELSNQLKHQENSLVDQVSEQVLTSARSYLTAVGDIANRNASDIILSGGSIESIQTIFDKERFLGSGYIYVVDEVGTIIYHPNRSKIGGTSTTKKWLLEQKQSVNSYYKYEYENRDKLLYKIYNSDLKWNIMVSAYVDDFSDSLDFYELNLVMNEIKVGKTGYPMLLNVDGFVVSHPNEELVNQNLKNLTDSDGNKIIQRIIDEKNGEFKYNWEEKSGEIKEKFIFFIYEKNSKLIICATGYMEDFYGTVNVIKQLITISGFIILAAIFIIIYLIATTVSKPIQVFTHSLKEISEGDGDLTNRINIKSSGEIGIMVNSFNKFINNLQHLIINIKKATLNTIIIKDEVSAGINEASAALHQISTNISEIQNQTNNLNSNILNSVSFSDEILNSAQDLNLSVDDQSTMLQTSTAAITEMISSITNVDNITVSKMNSAKKLLQSAKDGSEAIDNTQFAVQNVSSQLENIQEMAQVISNIANQTNLLAMNAAIEAAHAGDAGKGFAVVADEIRKLAETSSSNSKNIKDTLSNVSTSILTADKLSNNTRNSFSNLNSEIIDIVDALSEIMNSTNELEVGGKEILYSITGLEEASNVVKNKASIIKDLSTNVKVSMEDTSNISLEVFTAIDEINLGTKGISESMQVVTDSTFKLKTTGDELHNNINQFKID